MVNGCECCIVCGTGSWTYWQTFNYLLKFISGMFVSRGAPAYTLYQNIYFVTNDVWIIRHQQYSSVEHSIGWS